MQLVSETLDHRKNPIASLVLSMNWGEEELDLAHDLFEEVDTLLQKNEEVNWAKFEGEFSEKLGIGYQGVKSIVLAFFRNYQWVNVCVTYARKHKCIEFHEIIDNAE